MNPIQKKVFQYLLGSISPEPGNLPTEQELATRFQTTRHNVHSVFKKLEEQELISSNKKGGTRWKRRPSQYELRSFQRLFHHRIGILNTCPSTYRHLVWNDELLIPLTQILHQAGYEAVPYTIEREPRSIPEFQELFETISRQNISALIMIPTNDFDCDAHTELLFRFFDVVILLDRSYQRPIANSLCNIIGINHFADGMLAAETAVKAGAKRLLFCSFFFEPLRWLQEKYHGAQLGCRRISDDQLEVELFVAKNERDFPLQASAPDTVLIAANDLVAAQLINNGCARRIFPGNDYRIIGFGNDSNYRQYNLTTVAPDLGEIGRIFAEQMIQSLNTLDTPIHTHLRIASRLIRRGTL